MARFADEYNVPFADADTVVALNRGVDEVCRAHDRDPATVLRSAAQVLCVGRDEPEIARRAGAIGREVDELRSNGLAGTPDEVIAKVERFASIGMTRLYLQVLDLDDLEHLALVAEKVMPAVASS